VSDNWQMSGRGRVGGKLSGCKLEDVMSLSLVLNGQPRTFTTLSQSPSLDQLVAELGLQGDRVAVEHNGTIIPRATWPQTTVNAGDRLEVVHFVGGG
jgi:sulfur carrier protein